MFTAGSCAARSHHIGPRLLNVCASVVGLEEGRQACTSADH